MKTSTFLSSAIAVLAMSAPSLVLAQRQYGPQDEGRTFNDGSRVICSERSTVQNSRDPNRVAGTATGAVIGGLLGNQIGSGSGRKVATVGGAVAGGAIGRHVQGQNQEARGQRRDVVTCERVWR